MKIAPSILSADFAHLAAEVQTVEQGGADYLHIDVMDGQFVPNLTFGMNVVKALRPLTKLPLDVHLMMVEPERYVDEFAKAGADIITVHAESTLHLHRTLQMIKAQEVKVGVALNPATPIVNIQHVLSMVDLVLVMTVNPGFGGQAFIPEMLEKVQEVAQLRKEKGYQYEIEVDGGIVPDTAQLCADQGADVFVAGSFIYNGESPAHQIMLLKDRLNQC